MGRPRKIERLVGLSGRIRPEQETWLRKEADRRFDGELSRTLRWALDSAETFANLLKEGDPAEALDRVLNPMKFGSPDEEDEREREAWAQELARRELQVERWRGGSGS